MLESGETSIEVIGNWSEFTITQVQLQQGHDESHGGMFVRYLFLREVILQTLFVLPNPVLTLQPQSL